MAGGFLAGAGKAVNDYASEQENKAFELKLMSTKLEMEHRNRIEEAIQTQSAEKARYDRESKISSGVSDAVSKTLGKTIGDLRTTDAPIVDTLIKDKQMQELKNVTSSPVPDEVGIPQYQVRHNMLGYQVGSPTPMTDYATKRAMYDKLVTYHSLLEQAHGLYNDLSVHNALGAGSILNHFPEDISSKRAELLAVNKQLAPLEASIKEGVPGGRFSQMLGDQMAASTQIPQHSVNVANDLFDNSNLMTYSKIRDISPLAKMPQSLVDKFGGLLHDQGGNLINPHDITIKEGNIYYAGSSTPVGNTSSPFLAVHPHAAQSFAKHVQSQAPQSPFSDPSAFAGALGEVRASNQ